MDCMSALHAQDAFCSADASFHAGPSQSGVIAQSHLGSVAVAGDRRIEKAGLAWLGFASTITTTGFQTAL